MTQLRYPIYILSKGRAGTCKTPGLLNDCGVPFTLVVEPQDAQSYGERFPGVGIHVLTENDRGIAFARSSTKDRSMGRGEEWHWQIDDDIKSFRRRVDGKNLRDEASNVLSEAEDYVSYHTNIGLAGLCHITFAWTQRTPLNINRQCATVVLVKANKLRWRDGVIEDTDYSMQVLTGGLCTVQFNRLIHEPSPIMSMGGGNTDSQYRGNRWTEMAEGLQRAWPGAFTLRTNKAGMLRVSPSRVWRTFPQRPTAKPS